MKICIKILAVSFALLFSLIGFAWVGFEHPWSYIIQSAIVLTLCFVGIVLSRLVEIIFEECIEKVIVKRKTPR